MAQDTGQGIRKAPALLKKPSIFMEAQLTNELFTSKKDQLRMMLEQWIRRHFAQLEVGQQLDLRAFTDLTKYYYHSHRCSRNSWLHRDFQVRKIDSEPTSYRPFNAGYI